MRLTANKPDSREDMSQVSGCPLEAVSVVDLSLAGLHIHVEMLEVVVKVHGPGAQMPAQQRGVGREHSGHLDIDLNIVTFSSEFTTSTFQSRSIISPIPAIHS